MTTIIPVTGMNQHCREKFIVVNKVNKRNKINDKILICSEKQIDISIVADSISCLQELIRHCHNFLPCYAFFPKPAMQHNNIISEMELQTIFSSHTIPKKFLFIGVSFLSVITIRSCYANSIILEKHYWNTSMKLWRSSCYTIKIFITSKKNTALQIIMRQISIHIYIFMKRNKHVGHKQIFFSHAKYYKKYRTMFSTQFCIFKFPINV